MTADLIKRQDVIDAAANALTSARITFDSAEGPQIDYWDGYCDGLSDLLDCLTGFCPEFAKIQSVDVKNEPSA